MCVCVVGRRLVGKSRDFGCSNNYAGTRAGPRAPVRCVDDVERGNTKTHKRPRQKTVFKIFDGNDGGSGSAVQPGDGGEV